MTPEPWHLPESMEDSVMPSMPQGPQETEGRWEEGSILYRETVAAVEWQKCGQPLTSSSELMIARTG